MYPPRAPQGMSAKQLLPEYSFSLQESRGAADGSFPGPYVRLPPAHIRDHTCTPRHPHIQPKQKSKTSAI
jgi:hypothetical protein